MHAWTLRSVVTNTDSRASCEVNAGKAFIHLNVVSYSLWPYAGSVFTAQYIFAVLGNIDQDYFPLQGYHGNCPFCVGSLPVSTTLQLSQPAFPDIQPVLTEPAL